jgi:hypothetical protein
MWWKNEFWLFLIIFTVLMIENDSLKRHLRPLLVKNLFFGHFWFFLPNLNSNISVTMCTPNLTISLRKSKVTIFYQVFRSPKYTQLLFSIFLLLSFIEHLNKHKNLTFGLELLKKIANTVTFDFFTLFYRLPIRTGAMPLVSNMVTDRKSSNEL